MEVNDQTQPALLSQTETSMFMQDRCFLQTKDIFSFVYMLGFAASILDSFLSNLLYNTTQGCTSWVECLSSVKPWGLILCTTHLYITINTIQYYALIMLNALFPKYTYTNEPQPDQEMTLGSISYPRVTTTLTPIICLSVNTTQMESQGTGSFVAELSSFTQDYNHEAHPHQCVDQQSIPFMVCPIFLYGYHTLCLSTFLQWIFQLVPTFGYYG